MDVSRFQENIKYISGLEQAEEEFCFYTCEKNRKQRLEIERILNRVFQLCHKGELVKK